MNQVQLSVYLEWSDCGRYGEEADSRTVWYDDVVVATRYIGPRVRPQVAGSGRSGGTPALPGSRPDARPSERAGRTVRLGS